MNDEIALKTAIALLEYRLNCFRQHVLDARLEDTRRMYKELCEREEKALAAARGQLDMLTDEGIPEANHHRPSIKLGSNGAGL